MRHRMSESGPTTPVYVHLRHMYIEGDELREAIEKMGAFQKRNEGRNW